MPKYIISGIQQMGIGVKNVHEAFAWYRKNFGFDIPVFDEAAMAPYMLPYTGGKPRERHAILAINLQGGGGFEIWQYTNRTPQPPVQDILTGDLGINITKLKTNDIKKTYTYHQKNNNDLLLSEIQKDFAGKDVFYCKDLYGNIFEYVQNNKVFAQTNAVNGGVFGAIIGVSDIDKSVDFYGKLLGYDKVVADTTAEFNDFANLSAGKETYRRVLLQHSKDRVGAFSNMLGTTEIELIQSKERAPQPIFKGRFWGDLGFIHLCFDVNGMDEIRNYCKQIGHPFTVDVDKTFDMGDAGGKFSYIEDPDGTLIEFVETHKVPVMKKINWYINLKKRNPQKPLANFMLKAMKYNRIKD